MTLKEKQIQNNKILLAIKKRLQRGYKSRIAQKLCYTRQNLYKHLNPENSAFSNLEELTRINKAISELIEEDKQTASKIIQTLQ